MRISLDETGNYLDAVVKEGDADPEYDALMEVLRTAPHEEGKLPKLKYPELTWELVDDEPEPDLTSDEILAILLGEGDEE